MIHQNVKNGNYEAKLSEKCWRYFINDLINNGIEYPVDFLQYMKEKGIKQTNNTDLIDFISKELPNEKQIAHRQNRKGNSFYKNIYINSKCLHHPKQMAEILCRYIKCKCEDENEEILKDEIKVKIDEIERLKGSNQSNWSNFSDQNMDVLNSIDDSYDIFDYDQFDNYFFQ